MSRSFGEQSSPEAYWFATRFEEMRVLGYLRNVINSNLAEQRSEQVVNMVVAIFGRSSVADSAEQVLPDIVDNEKHRLWVENKTDFHILKGKKAAYLLRKSFLPKIEHRIAKAVKRRSDQSDRRLEILSKTLNLSEAEKSVVAYFYLWKCSSITSEYFCSGNYGIVDMNDVLRFRVYGNSVLGLSRADFLRVFTEGVAIPAGLLERPGSSLDLVQWCIDYLSGIGHDSLANEFFTAGNDEDLEISDFDVPDDELQVLDGLLKGKAGRNILFYGTPGTGKTSFAKTLAKRYGKNFLSVKMPESDNVRERLLAVYAAANMAGTRDSLVLVDEADEILNTAFQPFGGKVVSKSWVNNFLDNHGKKIIWISNRSAQIDPSTMRRFAFSLEFRPFTAEKRLKVLKWVLAKSGVAEGYFTEEELKDLSRSYAVNASGLVHAINSVAINARTKKANALRRIRTILRNHEKAIGGSGTIPVQKSFDHYTLEGLNASADLGAIVEAVKRAVVCREGDTRSVSMLLYGMPGTGKTEFVNYLGHVLGREVLLKRSSDVQSMWVGQTEKNIASAFQEARERGVVLFFDEADSFLFPRTSASHSWEKSHTNEILTQLENHRGVVIFATNDIDGLDHAALRRFGFKVRFEPLKPEGIMKFYEILLAPLVPGKALSHDEEEHLAAVPNLTPGDFAVVRNQVALLGADSMDHGKLIESLENEVRYKKAQGRKVVGF